MYRLFSWEHSYFSAKARAYLRYKERCGALGPGFEDILATPELINGLLIPATGSNLVPQLQTPGGDLIQDTSEILDVCEAAHPDVPVIPDVDRPKQRLVSYLIELLADEWLVVPGFWTRWYYSEDGRQPNHRKFNEHQFGAVLSPDGDGAERRKSGAMLFEERFGISTSRSDPKGTYAGLVHLGCNEETEQAWEASLYRILERLEAHFELHDYLLGGRPSMGDFALLGPLYAHIYRDAVTGFMLRSEYPLVAEWVERANGEGSLNARTYNQKLYSLDEQGQLVGRVANSDGGEWLADDEVPETLIGVLEVFFDEMWPFLLASIEKLEAFIAGEDHQVGGELPNKTFFASPGFLEHQTNGGALTVSFKIGDVDSERMVVPYQIWMLNRLESAMEAVMGSDEGRSSVADLLEAFPEGDRMMELETLLSGCRIEKRGGKFFSVDFRK